MKRWGRFAAQVIALLLWTVIAVSSRTPEPGIRGLRGQLGSAPPASSSIR